MACKNYSIFYKHLFCYLLNFINKKFHTNLLILQNSNNNESIYKNKFFDKQDSKFNKTISGGICGLNNLGNSWYMNSALQMFWHLPNIRDYFLDGQYERDKERYKLNSYISDELQKVINNLWKWNKSSFCPKSFKDEARKYIELLDNYNQQDSADFLIQLLELIHNELTG